MKPKTIDSIIEELCPNIFITDHYKDKKDKCKKQLIELFMSCVPINATLYNPHGDGWNDCRDQMIKNIEKLKGE